MKIRQIEDKVFIYQETSLRYTLIYMYKHKETENKS